MYALMQYGITELWLMLNNIPFGYIPQLLYIISNLTIDKRMGKMATLVFFNVTVSSESNSHTD